MQPFRQVYEEYYEMIYRFLLRLCRNQALAEELCQETFYQALKGWKKYRGEAKISTWLCTIAKRTYFDTMRKTRPMPLETAKDETDVSELLVKSDRMMTAQKALHALPEESRKMSEEEEALFQKKVKELLRKRRRRMLRNVLAGIVIGVVLLLAVYYGKYELYDNLHAKNMEPQDYQMRVVRLANGDVIAAGKTFDNLLSGGHAMRTVEAEDGKRILSINVHTSILPHYGSSDTKLLFDLQNWEYDAICAGPDLELLIWEEGMAIPAASEELEAYFALELERKLLKAEVDYLNQVNWIMGLEDTEAENWPYLQSAGEKLDQLWEEMMELKDKAPEWQ